MTMTRNATAGAAMMALAALGAPPAVAEIGDPAGVAGAVQGSVALDSPARNTTIDQLASGERIVMGDAVNTRAKSRLQIMLLDQTAITMGENASLVIDEFVYTPESDGSALLATVNQGAFRLVTGGVARANPEGTKVVLPSAVLTIRGTTTQGNCDASGCIVALSGTGDQNSAGKKPSQILIQSQKDTKILKRAGFFVLIRPDGSMTDPAPLEEESAEKLTRLFDPIGGGGGGGDGYAGGMDLVDASGQPTADGGPLAGDVGDLYGAIDPVQSVGFESTANLPSGQLTYFADDIPLTGPGFVGDYDVNYTLDLGSRSFSGSIGIFATGTAATVNGTFQLLHNPFDLGFQNLHETGFVIDTPDNDSIVVDYSIGPNQIDTAVSYSIIPTIGGPATLTGAGPAPLQP